MGRHHHRPFPPEPEIRGAHILVVVLIVAVATVAIFFAGFAAGFHFRG